LVVGSIRGQFSRLKPVWADEIYERVINRVASWRSLSPIRLEVVERTGPGFKVVRRCWVVERCAPQGAMME
jgi:hypothetical protein